MQPRLTAPNKTLSFSKARRQTSNSVSPISPEIRSPSFDLSDPLSTRFAQQTTLTSTVSNPAVAIKPSLSSTPSSLLRKQSDPSNLFTAAQTAALRTLCSNIALDLHDSSFWSSLLLQHKYPVTHTPQDAYDVEMATVGLAIDLAANNLRTCNFNKLCLYLLSLLRELKSHPQTIPVQTYNALFLFRVFSNHFAGNLTNDEMMDQFEGF
ncbi:uncharacterized protein BYT42DRAFT_69835 [Radiomyces spectabilis]|uniref:uncharacterized protein n=1 Tax=Radiomyces spectabilis TaxID=64574 RepID=UPI00221FE926|nr:uncharacterized protein BYT42DRAFT_69835 [Radiomyces spectabilis]KAI8371480.1 hypothetical protein BYT42DRAFT_69835 [Radiomyces spectabilis]